MRKLLISVITVVALANGVRAQDSQPASSLEVSNDGEVVSFEGSKQLTLKFWLQQLMISALYRNVIQDSSLDEWQLQVSVPMRIHCRYASIVTLAIPERQTLSFDEALLPLPSDRYPDYILIKRGQQVLRLGKYDPWVLRKLMSEAGLSRYEKLSRVERTLF